jgi:hypothetical protein
MKQLFYSVLVLALIGIAGFLYRSTIEHPAIGGGEQACTQEAKLCPDGSAVGRTGSHCTFAPCALPNVESPEYGIAFVLPAGYAADENAAGADPTMVGAFVKAATTTNALQTITVRDYPVPAGQKASDVMLAHTRLEPSDMQASDLKAFKTKIIGAHTFSVITTERFEGVITTSYFLPRAGDVLEFSIVEQDVKDWMNTNLNIDTLPAHAALLKLLGTLEVTKQ